MNRSMTEYLNGDLVCEDLLTCIHGLKDLDRACYRALVEGDGPLTVDDVAEEVDRERSTAYRSIRRLRSADLIETDQRSHEVGSYYHVYYPRDPADVAAEMQRTLNDWYAEMGQLVREYEETYGDLVERPPSPE